MEIKTSLTHRTNGFDVRGLGDKGRGSGFHNCQVVPLIEVGSAKGIPDLRVMVVEN